MLRTIRKENPELVRTLIELRVAAKKNDAPVWGAVAERLARARHPRSPINVAHLERLTKPNETVVVAGKVLAEGRLTKPLVVGAFDYSSAARAKIQSAGGQALSLPQLLESHPDGTGVRLLG